MNKFLRENKVSKMTNEQRNAWYAALSKPEKAVAICEDVLLQIKNEKYVMTHGTYFQVELANDISQRTVNTILKKEKLEDLVAAKSVTCSVCAMGSAFMSAVRLGNNCNAQELLDIEEVGMIVDYWGNTVQAYEPGETFEAEGRNLVDKLEEAFTMLEYRAMEYMFEGSGIENTFRYADEDALNKHYQEHYYIDDYDPTQQMQKLCKQIIKDKGYVLIPGVDLQNLDK